MKRNIAIYALGWVTYVTASFLLFPALSITVMLTSIPLTMLGGWLYLYKGAGATTLLTIPFHYALLSFYTDPETSMQEAFNPFGITTQIIFSFSTAFLKTQQTRYNTLNNSLKSLIKERTSELELLNAQLQRLKQEERESLHELLLKKPLQELTSMLSKSRHVRQRLETAPHPHTKEIEAISSSIHKCMESLQKLDWITSANTLSNNHSKAIQDLANGIIGISDISATVMPGREWKHFDNNTFAYLYDILAEAITNAIRHANARKINIGIEAAKTGKTVFVENDGSPLSRDFKEGMGMPLMRYRASKIGASLSLLSLPDNTTRLECIIPSHAVKD